MLSIRLCEKSRTMGLLCDENFNAIPSCDGRTDGQRELLSQYRTRLAMLWQRAIKSNCTQPSGYLPGARELSFDNSVVDKSSVRNIRCSVSCNAYDRPYPSGTTAVDWKSLMHPRNPRPAIDINLKIDRQSTLN